MTKPPPDAYPKQGMKYLGIDYGEKRIGLSFGDELGFAVPLPIDDNTQVTLIVISKTLVIVHWASHPLIALAEIPLQQFVYVLASEFVLHPGADPLSFILKPEAHQLSSHP